MGSSGPMTDVPGLMRNSGCDGAALPSFIRSALKLFHRATIFDGWQGLVIVHWSRAIVRPVARGAPNRSPSYSVRWVSSNVPNPARPSLDRKRAQRMLGALNRHAGAPPLDRAPAMLEHQPTLEHRLEKSRHFRRISRDPDPALFHDRQLLPGGAFSAGYDRTRVAHALSRRRRDARNESDHRLLHVVPYPARAGFLVVAADFSHHDHGVGLRVLVEHPHHIDMLQAVDRIAADADAGGLAESQFHQLTHRLVG